MENEFFGRSYQIEIDDGVETKIIKSGENAIRITFSLKKIAEGTSELNTGTLSLYNINDDTIARLNKLTTYVTIRAGYGSSIPMIFKGRVKFSHNEMSGADIVTIVTLLDTALGKESETIVVSTSNEITDYTLALYALGKMGVRYNIYPNASACMESVVHKKYNFSGKISELFSKIALSSKVYWKINDGIVHFYAENEQYVGEKYLISPKTGLIGKPIKEYTNSVTESGVVPMYGWEIRFLLNGAINTFSKIRVESEEMSGDFYVTKLSFSGDYYGNDWTGTAEVIQVDNDTGSN